MVASRRACGNPGSHEIAENRLSNRGDRAGSTVGQGAADGRACAGALARAGGSGRLEGLAGGVGGAVTLAAVFMLAACCLLRGGAVDGVALRVGERTASRDAAVGDANGGGAVKGDAARADGRGAAVSLLPPAVRDRVAKKRAKYLAQGAKRFDEPDRAMDFFMQQRLAGGMGTIPWQKLAAAREEIRRREAAQQAARVNGPQPAGGGRPPVEWTWLGPGNIGGRTRAWVIHPNQPAIMYAAGVAGGVWKTTNGGANWAPLDDLMLNLAVSSLVMDPTNPDVLYAGTGEGFFNGDAVRGLGVFKTVDGGATWEQLASTANVFPQDGFYYVNDLIISPNDPQRLYAGTRAGVWRTLDGGASWSLVLANPAEATGPQQTAGSFVGCTDLAVRSDAAPDVVFAAFGSFQTDGLYRSEDGGQTWQPLGTESDLVRADQGRMSIAIAPSENDIMYLCMANNGASAPAGTLVDVYRSMDGGDSWSARINFADEAINPWLLSNLPFANGCFADFTISQGWYDNIIAVDPLEPDTVWVGGIDLFRSTDGGQNFKVASYWYFDPDQSEYAHADHHIIVFHPNYNGSSNQTMYVGSDGGLFRTDNARASATSNSCPSTQSPGLAISWTNLNNGYGVTQFYHGDAAVGLDRFGGGTQDNGTNLVLSDATPNLWMQIFGGDGGYFQIDPTNSQVIYAETQNFPSIIKSVNGGASFFDATDGITDFDGLFITPFALNKNNPEQLWTGGRRAWRSTNGADSWQLASDAFGTTDPFEAAPDQVSAIAIAPSDEDTVYLGFDNGYIARTTGPGADPVEWEVFGSANGLLTNEIPPLGDFGAYVSSIAVHPANPDIAYCTYSTFGWPHVFKTTNGGQLWVPVDDGIEAADIPDIPAHWIAIRPNVPEFLYVGTELGVFASNDEGASWEVANDGLAHTVVESLVFQDEETLIAFTHGRGAFKGIVAPLDCDSNGVADTEDIASCEGSPECADCNLNSVPDPCEFGDCDPPSAFCGDCNQNAILDSCESPDCNENGIPDECDVEFGLAEDCNGDGVPDECGTDCNGNGVSDECEIFEGDLSDDDADGVPDVCETLRVDVDAPGGVENGMTWATAYQGLKEAVATASAQPGIVQEIWLAEGVYTPAAPAGDRFATFELPDGVMLYGGFTGDETSREQRDFEDHPTILSGDLNGDDGGGFVAENSYNVVTANGVGPDAGLDGLIVVGGNANGSSPHDRGAGLLNLSASPTVRNCTFMGNEAFNGGGVYNLDGSHGRFVETKFIDNRASAGAGMFNSNDSSPTLIGCLFEGNDDEGMNNNIECNPTLIDCAFADNVGHAMRNNASSPTVDGCSFEGNTESGSDGGAMHNRNGSDVVVINSVFRQNVAATRGGAVYNFASDPVLVGCVFDRNTVMNLGTGVGGGMYDSNSNPTVTNSTFSGNVAGSGGGIFHTASGSMLTLTNSILWGNTDNVGGLGAQVHVSSGALVATYCNIEDSSGLSGVGNMDEAPMFADAAGGDLRLLSGSPGIDAGNNNADTDANTAGTQPLPDDDVTGCPRRTDDPATADTGNGMAPIVDLGAYELNVPIGADADADCDVDLSDYATFNECYTGDVSIDGFAPPTAACLMFDFDGEGDVDMIDFGHFQSGFTGPR